MRIIEEMPQKEVIATCPHCGCKFAYDPEDDTFSGVMGVGVACPKCEEEIIINKYNRPLQFPDAYYHFGDGVKIESEQIEKWVVHGIAWLFDHPDETYWYTGSGDTAVNIMRFEGDDCFNIQVCKNYYEAIVSTEEACELARRNY